MQTTYTDSKGTTWSVEYWQDPATGSDWWTAKNFAYGADTYEELVDAIEYWADYEGPTIY